MRRVARIGLALLFAASMLFYVQRIVIPYQQHDAEIHNRPRGNLSDLYPRWLGTRELLLHGRDPYSPEMAREIQTGFYGRPLDPARAEDPKDEQRFAYPVYVAFLLAPTIHLPFDLVQTAFLWLLVVLSGASVLLWLDFLHWRPSSSGIAIAVLLTLGSFPVVQGVKLQQLSLLVGFLVALAFALLARGHLYTAGVLMAVAMIKPQLVIPIAGFLFLWSAFSWRKRRAWVLGFGLTMVVLLGASEWLLPGWIPRFRDGAVAYRAYAASSGVLDMLASPTGGKLLTVLLVLVVFALCWRSCRFTETQSEFQQMTALVLTATVVIIPMIVPYNQVLLLPSILLVAREWSALWPRSLVTRALSIAACVLIAWPWLATTALTLLFVMIPPEQVQRGWGIPLISSLFIPIAVIALQLVSIATQNANKPENV
jgi:Glycosyltransferase family 87